jgi:formate dehydrogenase maturation protein FdhE|tara:strand:+ start:3965 stop:4141 length:177 start_codon:yes stop_codon:yes gene_type:complete
MLIMNCWHCNTKLIWNGDQDLEDDIEYDMLTTFTCQNCESYVEVYNKRKGWQERILEN